MKLSDYVFRFISELGVRHVFLLPGGGAMHLVDSLGHCPGLEFICNLHEQAAAIAAEAYAKVTNNLGVALVTSGPGGTNAVTGVAGAWLDSTPCLFLSGQVKRADLKRNSGVRQLGVQEIDIIPIVESITKYAVTVMEPESIRYHLEKALYLAKSGRPGPVWLDIPLDVQAAQIEPDVLETFSPSVDKPDSLATSSAIMRALDLLNESERPVLLAGNGIRTAGAQDDFRKLVEVLGIQVLTTWLGMDLLADAHPLFAGRPGSIAPRGANFALQNSDLLLSIGARLDLATCGYAYDRLARGARKIVVDIDAAEIGKLTCNVDVPLVADAGTVIRGFLEARQHLIVKDRGPWLDRCRDWKARYPVRSPGPAATDGRLSMYVFSEALGQAMDGGDLIVPGSSGFAPEIFFLMMKVKAGQRILHTRGLGAMGFGLPASIGACLAASRRRTICVDGDGGFQLNVQELETVARLALPIKFFVVNNGGYASIRSSQQSYFGRTVGCDPQSGLTLPDITRVAVAYGVPAFRIRDEPDLVGRIQEVLATPGPAVCEVTAIPDEARAPRLSSFQRPDGSLFSKPLEDLWPFLDREQFFANMLVPPVEER